MSEIQDLKLFNNSCEEFMMGKYILADIKISSILKLIAENDKLKNIVSSCLLDYNFDLEYKKYAIVTEDNASFSIPSNDKEIIPFVYSLLYKFSTGAIKFNDFLNRFYNIDDMKGASFEAFAKYVIYPFKNAINNTYSKRHILVETKDYQNNIYNKIMSTIKLILKNVDIYKLNINQKEEFTMLLNSLYYSSEKNDKKMVYSLMVGLDYFTKANKRTRNAYLSLEECFEQ